VPRDPPRSGSERPPKKPNHRVGHDAKEPRDPGLRAHVIRASAPARSRPPRPRDPRPRDPGFRAYVILPSAPHGHGLRGRLALCADTEERWCREANVRRTCIR
jgi:hypothetical protein